MAVEGSSYVVRRWEQQSVKLDFSSVSVATSVTNYSETSVRDISDDSGGKGDGQIGICL
jgi:hypothetical protein